MSEFKDNLKYLRNRRNLTQEELAACLNISKSRIGMYETGKRKPDFETLELIADFFNTDMNFLIGGEKKTYLPNYENIIPLSTQKLPLLGEIACGEPIFANENKEIYIEVGSNINADFCLQAKGDSMIGARILDGDIVFIKQQSIVENGEIAAVVIEDEATLKRVYYYPEERTIRLLPENPKYKPIIYTGVTLEQIHILGKAVAFQSTIKTI